MRPMRRGLTQPGWQWSVHRAPDRDRDRGAKPPKGMPRAQWPRLCWEIGLRLPDGHANAVRLFGWNPAAALLDGQEHLLTWAEEAHRDA